MFDSADLDAADADWRSAQRLAARHRILDAAWTQAAQQGVGALSLRQLARSLGMTAPSLYSYFPSKDAIYDAMYAAGWRDLTRHMATVDLASGSRADRLTRLLRAYLDYCGESLARYELMSSRPVPGWEPSREAYAAARAAYDALVVFLDSCGIRGQRRVDLFTAVMGGLAAQQMSNEPGGDRWLRLSGEAARMLIAHGDHTEEARS